MKIIKWISDNLLFLATLFLLALIPLYPKLPILGINHTWVYIRAEDFIVSVVFLVWIILLFAKKITLKTPLTMPIMLFWIVGGISTIHGILLIFPTLANVFPNVALLNYLRRIEYLGLFFIAYSGIKDKRHLGYIITVVAMVLFLVVVYGVGQRYFEFPAYLTMNEEYAKGIPIQLSPQSRVSSTFGGHYDLAAYLVLIIPLLSSIFFGVRNWVLKFLLVADVSLGFVLLFMTVSRVSFFVLLLSMIVVLAFHKKRAAILAIISLFFISIIFLSFSNSLMQRFGDTVQESNVLVDAATGEVIGQVKEVPSEDFKDKVIKIRYALNKNEVYEIMKGSKETTELATNSAFMISYSSLPVRVPLIASPDISTGENLPQGTGYINLTLAPITQKIGQFLYKGSKDVFAIQGNFLIKKVSAYDLSFTTRFQGEWPKTIDLFKKNVLLGSGYSSTGLAVDNNYLRILGEVGLLGFFSFFGIFFAAGIYIKRVLPEVDSSLARSFVFGLVAGTFGLALNAVFIDVFEASKIAFILWILIGAVIGILHLYQNKVIDFYGDFKKAITSTYAIIFYLFIVVVVVFSSIFSHYFVGDDFTWFRWAADCSGGFNQSQQCHSAITRIVSYFTESNGFFYRPGTKIYFWLMYSGFWLNQTMYHLVSIFLHFIAAVLLFLLAKKILKDFLLAVGASFLFVILSGYSEAVFWISSTGFLFNAVFVLLSLFFFISWEEKKKKTYFVLSLVSLTFGLLFHELGIITPLLILLYKFVFTDKRIAFKELFKKFDYVILFSPILFYLVLRYLAQSHWFNGDYSYNLFKLPYNIVGNIIGYSILNIFGPASLPISQGLRNFSKTHLVLSLLISIIIIFIFIALSKIVFKKMIKEEQRIVLFGSLFFVISLLPFLGLGNITSRYSYLSSIGFVLLFVFLLKKIYNHLISNGRQITTAILIIIISVFSLIHMIQLQKINRDWGEAGEKSKRFLIALDRVYENSWRKEPMLFYFVNVPIKSGEAWIFPVGLNDAIWFVLRNENVKIYQSSSLTQALDSVKPSANEKFFEFDDSGNFIERNKPQSASNK